MKANEYKGTMLQCQACAALTKVSIWSSVPICSRNTAI